MLTDVEDAAVIDKLFSIMPTDAAHADLLLCSLSSVLAWYQIELRGRTQLGEGVLEVKVADWEGLLVLNPDALSPETRNDVLDTFEPLRPLCRIT